MLVTDFKDLRRQSPRRMVGGCDDRAGRWARAALQGPPPAGRRLPRRGRAPPFWPPLADGCSRDIRTCPPPRAEGPSASASGARVYADMSDSGSLAFDKGHPCMTDRPHERESVFQAALQATPAMTTATKRLLRQFRAPRRSSFSRAHALGCTVLSGFGMSHTELRGSGHDTTTRRDAISGVTIWGLRRCRWVALDPGGCANPTVCPQSAFDLRAEFGSNGFVFSRRRPAAPLPSCCRSGRNDRMTVQEHAGGVQLYKRTG